MNGLELARGYYEEFGAPMLRTQFPQLEPLIAVGLVGAGSECFGFDDALSRDHDFEPGFCMFLPGEDVIDSRTAFALERAYAKLPAEYDGAKRLRLQPVGGSRHGVLRTADFYKDKLGSATGFHSLYDWFRVPDFALAEASNGEIFRDDYGAFSAIRNALLHMPEDVKRKKLAGHLLLMGQSGQYNYMRCVKHGESGGAQLAAFEFVTHAVSAVYLLNNRFAPFYKWAFRGLRELPLLGDTGDMMETLLTTGNEEETAEAKQYMMEQITKSLILALREQGLSRAQGDVPDSHADSLNAGIADNSLRNENILFAV